MSDREMYLDGITKAILASMFGHLGGMHNSRVILGIGIEVLSTLVARGQITPAERQLLSDRLTNAWIIF